MHPIFTPTDARNRRRRPRSELPAFLVARRGGPDALSAALAAQLRQCFDSFSMSPAAAHHVLPPKVRMRRSSSAKVMKLEPS
jgi:hypothetical protein